MNTQNINPDKAWVLPVGREDAHFATMLAAVVSVAVLLFSANAYTWNIAGNLLETKYCVFYMCVALFLIIFFVSARFRGSASQKKWRSEYDYGYVDAVLLSAKVMIIALCSMFGFGLFSATIAPITQGSIVVMDDGRMFAYPDSVTENTWWDSKAVNVFPDQAFAGNVNFDHEGLKLNIGFSAKLNTENFSAMLAFLPTIADGLKKASWMQKAVNCNDDLLVSVDWSPLVEQVLDDKAGLSVQIASVVPLLFVRSHMEQIEEVNPWLKELEIYSVKIVAVSKDK